MGKRQLFLIAGESFTTKSSLQERIKTILHRYKNKEYLSKDDFEFMFEVLKMHPDASVKIGNGVKAIYIKQNPIYKNTRGFWIVREDNSETDFSYLECLKETPHERLFISACRVAISPYIKEFKENFFDQLPGKKSICPFTGELISLTNSHVDHKAPLTFQKIVNLFLDEYKIDPKKIKINGKGEDGIVQSTFSDKKLEQKWIEYHNKVAQLQIVSRKANLSILKTSAN